MLDSYFFVPGDKQKYLNKITDIKSTYIVIDLVDAVALKSKKDAFDMVMSISFRDHYFVRIPFFENCYSEQQLIQLINHSNGKIVIPKLKDATEIIQIKNLLPGLNLKSIILIENPLCFLNLPDILKSFSSQIHAIGFGCHDFCSLMGIKRNLENLLQYKRELVLYAKAFNIAYVDGVDLNLNDFQQFREECLTAFNIGADGKFLIHPTQLNELYDVKYLSETDLRELKYVYGKIKNISDNDMEVHIIDGKIYEKPHILRIKALMNKMLNINNLLNQ